jgi:hypothetical protein
MVRAYDGMDTMGDSQDRRFAEFFSDGLGNCLSVIALVAQLFPRTESIGVV